MYVVKKCATTVQFDQTLQGLYLPIVRFLAGSERFALTSASWSVVINAANTSSMCNCILLLQFSLLQGIGKESLQGYAIMDFLM